MDKLPFKYILTLKPKDYLKQGLSHCGVYSLKAILSVCDKDVKNHPKEYHSNWVGRHFFSFATGKYYYDRIFRSFGIRSKTKSAKHLSDKEKINTLKTLLSRDTPIMIRIGNGYLDRNYNSVLGRIIPHWITLWGYDDNKQIFYVYDSGLPVKYWNNSLSIGNTTRIYSEILRDWNFGKWQPWCWNISFENYLYVEILNR